MTTFAYTALDRAGSEVNGQIEAADRPAAVRDLTERGVAVVQIRAAEAGMPFAQLAAVRRERLRIRPKRLAILTRQLAISLEAGLPLVSALEVMSEELDHAPSRELLKHLRTRVEEGLSLSDAMTEHTAVFTPMYIRLVRVGETGGILDAVLTELADMLERQTELRERVKTASVYPAIVLLLGIVSVVIIVSFIVPSIIESIGADPSVLPWPTRVLLGLSHAAGNYGWLLLILLAAMVVFWRQVVSKGNGRRKWDQTKLHVPILGRLIRAMEAGRFARSLGLLARSGVTITESLAVVAGTLQNTVLRQAVEDLRSSVQSGEPIAKPLQRCGQFPPLLVQMVRVGENTGRLDEMLLRAAAVHESEARVALDRLVNILPVLMIVALACVIGFIVAALVLAIVEFQTTGLGTLGGQ